MKRVEALPCLWEFVSVSTGGMDGVCVRDGGKERVSNRVGRAVWSARRGGREGWSVCVAVRKCFCVSVSRKGGRVCHLRFDLQ